MKKLFLLLGFSLFVLRLSAQDSGSGNGTVLTVTVEDEAQKTSLRELWGYRMNIKANPIMAAFGELPFYVEAPLGKYLSLEGAAGPTFKYFIPTLDYAFFMPSFSDASAAIKGDLTRMAPSYLYKASLCFYPKKMNEDLEGSYLAISYRYRRYYDSFDPEDGDYYGGPLAFTEARKDILIETGIQAEHGKRFSTDFYAGAGISTFPAFHFEKLENYYLGNTYSYVADNKTSIRPTFNLGFRLVYELNIKG
jgi:hypothetical protein